MNDAITLARTDKTIVLSALRSACKHHRIEVNMDGVIISTCAFNGRIPGENERWVPCNLDCPYLNLIDDSLRVRAQIEGAERLEIEPHSTEGEETL